MQTFLPHPNFAVSAMVLDRQRLGKQRLECVQILRAMKNGGGWSKHPAVTMWRGSERALQLYHDVVVREWVARGYKNSMELFCPDSAKIKLPWWLGDDEFHSSHRAALLLKNPDYYGQFGWSETPQNCYIWPGERQ